jgi:hypothetical protein
MYSFRMRGLLVLLTFVALAPANGQDAPGWIRGIVRSAGDSSALIGVEVRLVEHQQSVMSGAGGAFGLGPVPAGRWRIELRRIGFAPLDTIVEASDQSAKPLTLFLRATAQTLDTVNVSAAGRLNRAGSLPEFDARRAHGTGRYLDAAQLRAEDERSFTEVLRSRIPGLMLEMNPTGVYAYSPSQQPPGALYGSNAGKRPCYVQVAVDGVMIYQQTHNSDPGDTPPDLSQILTRSLDGVEYYSQPSRTPPEFKTPGSQCGTLVLWTRRR